MYEALIVAGPEYLLELLSMEYHYDYVKCRSRNTTNSQIYALTPTFKIDSVFCLNPKKSLYR